MKKRETLDLTDNELNIIALSIESYINNRETYMTKKKCRIINNVIKKIINNGMNRSDPKSILYPLVEFDSEEDEED